MLTALNVLRQVNSILTEILSIVYVTRKIIMVVISILLLIAGEPQSVLNPGII